MAHIVRNQGLPRRWLLAVPALAAPFVSRKSRADEAEVTWALGHTAPADFPQHFRLVGAASAIRTASQGAMDIKIYPSGERGGPAGLLAQVRAGTLDAALLSNQALDSDLATLALPMVGFAFTGYETLWPAMDGGLGAMLRQLMETRLGLAVSAKAWDFGFRQVTTTTRQINSAADMEGLRLRTPSDAAFISIFQSLKALPVALPFNGLDRAIRSHQIDGQEGVLAVVKAIKLFDIQAHCAATNHVWDGQWLCISRKSWAALPDRLREIVTPALEDAAIQQRGDVATEDKQTRAEAEKAGMAFNTVDIGSFRAMLSAAGYYKERRAKLGETAWASLEKYTGALG